jgi:divalent metal cation (Fe/Co/Zn/Cd) transporter
MAKYEFAIDVPIYLPLQAIEELKTRIKERVKDLAAKCGEYQVDIQVKMKMMPSAEQKAEEEEKEGGS